MPKNLTDTRGYQTDCYHYDPCPLCYGCRNYRKYYINRCDERCGKPFSAEHKFNVCSKPEIHNEHNFELMIQRTRLEM